MAWWRVGCGCVSEIFIVNDVDILQGGPDLACAGGNFAFRMLSLDAPAFGFAADTTGGSKGGSGSTKRW